MTAPALLAVTASLVAAGGIAVAYPRLGTWTLAPLVLWFAANFWMIWPVDPAPACNAAQVNGAAVVCASPKPRLMTWQ